MNNETPVSAIAAPMEMLLFCPRCGMQHVDAPNEAQGWTNPPHATHTCQGCGLLWRPCNENTTGVLHIAVKEEKHRERILASWPSSHERAHDEGYPGIAHDLETMRTALDRAAYAMREAKQLGVSQAALDRLNHAYDAACKVLDESPDAAPPANEQPRKGTTPTEAHCPSAAVPGKAGTEARHDSAPSSVAAQNSEYTRGREEGYESGRLFQLRRCAEMCREHESESPFAAKLGVQMERAADELSKASAVSAMAAPEHVCGLQGYNPAIDAPCPGCAVRRGTTESGSAK